MAETPSTFIGQITLPIFTRVGTTGELIHLGDMTLDIPIDVQTQLPIESIEATVQEHLNGEFSPAPDIEQAVGPHSRACGILPHQHGDRCSKDCPTCYTFKHSQDGPYLVSPYNPANQKPAGRAVTVPDGDVPAPGPAAPEVSGG